MTSRLSRVRLNQAHMNPLLYFNPFMAWSVLGFKMLEMASASSQVIHHRTQRMANASYPLSKRDQTEFILMGAEKRDAVLESAREVGMPLLTFGWQLIQLSYKQMLVASEGLTGGLPLASGNSVRARTLQTKLVNKAVNNWMAAAPTLTSSAAKVASKALKPVHSRATANAKRLSKLKK